MSKPQVESVKQGELNCWRISNGSGELLVAQQGAQVLSYTVEGQPLIWLNEQAAFVQGKPVRAGVPVCWPWFGNLARNPGSVQSMRAIEGEAPAHGLVRAMDWRLLDIKETDNEVRIDFDLPQADGELPGWPHRAELKMSIVLGENLDISLSSRNLGNQPLSLSQALHSYFVVSDVRRVSAEGLSGLNYIETLENWQPRNQAGELSFTGETDRIYLDTPSQLSIVDPVWKRRIRLTSRGSRSAVVWNPWIGRATQLSDMADDGWQQMLCIETANVMDDIVHLAPGQSHTLGIKIESTAL